MERIIKRILVATGLCLSLAVALMPLTSYAVAGHPNDHGFNCDNNNNECATSNGSTEVTVRIDPSISIDAVADTEVIRVTPAMTATGKLSVQVRSAMSYTISLSADVPFLQNTESEEFVIPSSSNIVAGKSAWGIKKQDATEYSAITTTPEVFFTSAAMDEPTWTDFEVGVSASSKLPQGRYSTTVNITAAIKQ